MEGRKPAEKKVQGPFDDVDLVSDGHATKPKTVDCGHRWRKGISPKDGKIRTCIDCLIHEKVTDKEWANLAA